MAKHAEVAMERVNLMLDRRESEWLDQLVGEILAKTGAKVSRSEIVRAAVATLHELDRMASLNPARLLPLAQCKTGADLVVAGVSAIRLAVTP
jgi:hypothetical protein